MNVRKLVLMVILADILICADLLLFKLPNIQVVMLLILVYTRVLSFKSTKYIILLYVFIDSLITNTLASTFIPMLIAWIIISFIMNFIKTKKVWKISIYAIIFSFIYSYIFLFYNVIYFNIDIYAYFLSDIYFELILALSSFLSVLWLFNPLTKNLENILAKGDKKNE